MNINELLADTSTLDYIAHMFYATERQGVPCRWLCLDPKIQKQYLEKARDQYKEWADDERSAQVRRTTND